MSRFLDQIRKAKEARERAARKANLSRKKPPVEEEKPLVPEKKPIHRPPSPAEMSDHLFPSALEKKQRGVDDEKAIHDSDSDNQDLYPDGLEEEAPALSVQDTQPLERPRELVPEEMADGAPKKEKPPEPTQPILVPTEMADESPRKEEPSEPTQPILVPSEIADGAPNRKKPPEPSKPVLVPSEMADGSPKKEEIPEPTQPILVPSEIADGAPNRKKPPEPTKPVLVPSEMSEPRPPREKPAARPETNLIPGEMAEGAPPKIVPFSPPKPDLVPREMAEPKVPEKKAPAKSAEELVPEEMAQGPLPKVKLPSVPKPDLVPKEMAEGPPPKEKPPEPIKPDLVPREMAEPKVAKEPRPAAPQEDLVPGEIADTRPRKETPAPAEEEELVPSEMARGVAPKEKEIASPEPDLVPPETFEGIASEKEPESEPEVLIPPEMTGFQSFKEEETSPPEPDLVPQNIPKPPEINLPEEPLNSELVPGEKLEEYLSGKLDEEEEGALEAPPESDLVPEEEDSEKARRKRLLAETIAQREQKLAEEREEEISAQFEKEIFPSSSEAGETEEIPAAPVDEDEIEEPLVPEDAFVGEETGEETVALGEEIEEPQEAPEVNLVFPEDEPDAIESNLEASIEDLSGISEGDGVEETSPREEFDERDFIERFEEEERLAGAEEKPFVANLNGSRLTEESERDIIKEREELFPKELVTQDRSQDAYYPEKVSSGGRISMEKTEVFPSDEIESGVSTPKPRVRRKRPRGTITAPGPEADPAFVKRIMKVAPRPDKRVMSFYDPQNHVCEEYRLLGKNLIHTFATTPGNKNLGKVITLTSSARGEGKTLTSVNLSMTLAQDLKDRVLLLDMDLRHPRVHRYMGIPSGSGVNDLLASDDPESIFEDCITRTDTGLHLLTASSLGKNPSPILDSENMDHVLDLLRSRYSIIIADTPPVLLATDALTLGVKGDGMLFLLRARKTQREQIQEARQRIARLEIRMLGYVINNVKSFLPQIWRKYYYGNY